MKIKKLLMLVPVFALAACGAGAKELTKEEAKERANSILAAQAEITEVPDAYRFTTTSEMVVTMDEEVSEEMRGQVSVTVADSFYNFHYTAEMSEGEETMAQELNIHAYVKDNAFILAIAMEANGQSQKAYAQEEIPEGQEFGSDEVVATGSGLVGSLLKGAPTTLDLDTMFNQVILEGVENLFPTEEEITLLGLTSYTISAKSKGEGHLALESTYEMSYTEDGITSTLVGSEKFVWENNLVVEIVADDVITESMEGFSMTMDTYERTTIKYSAKASYPDLTGYTLETA